MSKEPEVKPRWDHMVGGISKTAMWTIFEITVSLNGKVWGQEVHVRTGRLERHPELYARTLDWMVRDIEAKL